MQPTPSDPASLSNLHDIIVPDPVSLWPLAPGWYVLAWLLLLALAFWVWSRLRRWRQNGYRRMALAALDQLEAAVKDPSRRVSALGELPALVKRVALSAWPRERVASLSGPALLAFLDQTGRTQTFQLGAGKALAVLAYDAQTAAALDNEHLAPLFSAVREWIKQHQVPSLSMEARGPDHDHV